MGPIAASSNWKRGEDVSHRSCAGSARTHTIQSKYQGIQRRDLKIRCPSPFVLVHRPSISAHLAFKLNNRGYSLLPRISVESILWAVLKNASHLSR